MGIDVSKFESWLKEGIGKVADSPIGNVVEGAVGRAYDKIKKVKDPHGVNNTVKRNEFEVSLLVLAAAVIKSNGDVSKFQIDYVKEFFTKNFDKQFIESRMFLLEQIIERNYSLKEVCLQIKKIKSHSVRLQLVQFLFHVADADVMIHAEELQVIRKISTYLGISEKDYYSMRSMFLKGKAPMSNKKEEETNYAILEVEKSATAEEIKKSYRRLAKKFHPDQIQHLGEDIKEAAKEKFDQLTKAYDQLMKNREAK